MIHRPVLSLIVVAVLLAGCGSTSGAVRSGGSDALPTTDVTTVTCGGSVYEPTGLADAPAASSLPDGPAGAVDDAGAPAFDPSQDWAVVDRSDDRVDLVRELDDPIDVGGGDVRTHESVTLERVTCHQRARRHLAADVGRSMRATTGHG